MILWILRESDASVFVDLWIIQARGMEKWLEWTWSLFSCAVVISSHLFTRYKSFWLKTTLLLFQKTTFLFDYLLNLLPYFSRFTPFIHFYPMTWYSHLTELRVSMPSPLATLERGDHVSFPKSKTPTANLLWIWSFRLSLWVWYRLTWFLSFRRLPSCCAGPPHPDGRPTRRGVLKNSCSDHRDDTHGTRGTQWHWPTEIIMIIACYEIVILKVFPVNLQAGRGTASAESSEALGINWAKQRAKAGWSRHK